MPLYPESEAVVINSGTVTFNTRLLVTSCSSFMYQNLYLDEALLISIVHDLASEHIITQINSVACRKDPNNLLRLLPSKTNPQLEKFFVILLGGRGNQGTKESRAQIREEFAQVLLTQINRTGTPRADQRIRVFGGYYREFSETLREILQDSEHKLTSHIDYDSNLNISYTEEWTPDLHSRST